jgi:DNA-binding NtrC family response regulator
MASPTIPDYSILITDDDPGVRETLRDIFVPHGYRTFLAESGEEAIDIVRVHPVHVAVLDMHLPRLSGLETLALVRQVRSALPAIMISGDWNENLMRRALSEHAYCVLEKPVSRHMVVHVVHKALQKFYSN